MIKKKNLYLPEVVKITKIEIMSPTVKLFRFKKTKGNFKKDKKGMSYIPGQFAVVGMLGYGESPFGILSSPYESRYFEIAVRNVGQVTSYLHTLKEGDTMHFRGPFGNGFPLEFMKGKDMLLLSGGCGIPPVAAIAEYAAKNRSEFGNVYFLYGARNPEEILMKEQMREWEKRNIKTIVTIDYPVKEWAGHVGFVTDLLDEIEVHKENTVAAMCGPGPMVEAIEKILRPTGISDRRIFVSMERKMQCGVGKCQHCTTGSKYVCKDGPVFHFDEVDKNWD